MTEDGQERGPSASAADLTSTVLAEEASRLQAEEADRSTELREDAELPGVGDKQMSLREGLAARR